MDYQRLMADLATSMVRTHGSLKEVIFMSHTNYISLLVFSDGIFLPTILVQDRF